MGLCQSLCSSRRSVAVAPVTTRTQVTGAPPLPRPAWSETATNGEVQLGNDPPGVAGEETIDASQAHLSDLDNTKGRISRPLTARSSRSLANTDSSFRSTFDDCSVPVSHPLAANSSATHANSVSFPRNASNDSAGPINHPLAVRSSTSLESSKERNVSIRSASDDGSGPVAHPFAAGNFTPPTSNLDKIASFQNALGDGANPTSRSLTASSSTAFTNSPEKANSLHSNSSNSESHPLASTVERTASCAFSDNVSKTSSSPQPLGSLTSSDFTISRQEAKDAGAFDKVMTIQGSDETISPLPHPDDKPALASLPSDGSSDEVSLTEFHPAAHKTEHELQCRRVVERLSPRDKEARAHIRQVLAQWKDEGVLSKIESHAMSIPASAASTVSGLAGGLAASNANYPESVREDNHHQQLVKAYAIFFWVATNISYDTELLHQFLTSIDGKVDCRAEKVLQKRKAICSGYANLYQALAEAAQLEVTVVHGNTKTWRIFDKEGPTGGGFQRRRSNGHSWNMVKVGVWLPVDCTEGSGSQVQMGFQRHFSPDYFAPAPEHLALTHLPSDPSWQLLQEPLSLQELRPLISPDIDVLGSGGIRPQDWSESIHVDAGAQSPVAQVCIHAESDVVFSADLQKVSQHQATPAGVHGLSNSPLSLDRSVFIETTAEGVHVLAAMPHAGHYVLKIYSKRQQEEHKNPSMCLSYVLQCDAATHAQVGYPLVFPKAKTNSFAFKLLHWGQHRRAHVCECKEGKMKIVFRALPGLDFFHCILPEVVDCLHVAEKVGSDGQHHHTFLVQDVSDPALYTLYISFPAEGWWTIYLSASHPEHVRTGGKVTRTPLFSYCVLAKQGHPDCYYPHMRSQIVRFSSAEPIISTGSGVFSLSFSSVKDLAFSNHLTRQESNGTHVEYCTLVSKEVDTLPDIYHYSLSVVFPEVGKWYVHVFAKDMTDSEPKDKADMSTKSFSALFTLCLVVSNSHLGKFPELSYTAQELDIALLHRNPVSYSDNTQLFCFEFLAPQGAEFMQELKLAADSDAPAGEDLFLDYCFLPLSSSAGDPCQYTLTALIPHPGRWMVELYMKRHKADKTFTGVITIPLEVKIGLTHSKRFVNLLPKFHHFNLGLCKEQQLYNTRVAGSEFVLPFFSPNSLHFMHALEDLSTKEKFDDYNAIVLHDQDHREANRLLRVLFPHRGTWLVQLYAGPQDEECNVCSLVLDARVIVEGYDDKHAFPKLIDPFYSKFGIKIDGADLPLLSRVHSLPHTHTIPFSSPSSVRLNHTAELTSDPGRDTYGTKLILDMQSGRHELVTEVSSWGQWEISLLAQPIDSDSESEGYVPVLHHMMTAEPDTVH